MLGNFPQAFTHVSLVNGAYNLDKVTGPAARRDDASGRERVTEPVNPSGHRPTWYNTPVQTQEAQRRGSRHLERYLVGGTAIVAFATRALLLLARPPALFPGTDNTWYDAVARSIEDGHLGRLPAVGGDRVLSIRFPPAYPYVLAVGRFLLFWVDSFDAHLWTGAALGAARRGRGGRARVASDPARAAPARVLTTIAAGLLFALNPNVVGASVSLMAEALVLPLVALVLLVIDRLVTGDGAPVGDRGCSARCSRSAR